MQPHDGYFTIWESWSPNEADDQWTVLEMRLSACVGIGSWKIVGGAKPTAFQRPSIRPQTIIEWNASRSDEVKNH